MFEYLIKLLTWLKALFGFTGGQDSKACPQSTPTTSLPNQSREASPKSSWLERKNAEFFRDECPVYLRWIFPNLWDFEHAFGKTLDRFFYSHEYWRVLIRCPEIHIVFVGVNVYDLRPEWNRRDTNLKRILLSEMRRAFVEYAASKGYNLSGISNYVITNIWLIDSILVMEIPESEFPFKYPHLARILAPENYWNFRRALDSKDHF